jgi:hypothetical protein
MEQPTIIAWTPANWITVVLMVAIGFAVLGALTRIVQQRRSGQQVKAAA